MVLFLKVGLAVSLFLLSLGIGLLFALVGLWSALVFPFLAPFITIFWRRKLGAGRARVYFLAFFASLVLEVLLLALAIQLNLMGMHRIMDGYAAPSSTQALLALAPLAFYWGCLSSWASKSRDEPRALG